MRSTLFIACVLTSAAPAAARTAGVRFQSPVKDGRVVCTFDTTDCAVPGRYHTGIDYHGPAVPQSGPVVRVAAPGLVALLVRNGESDHGLGNVVVIGHRVPVNRREDTTVVYTRYAHLASITPALRVGSAVQGQEVVGVMGASGYGRSDYWGRTPHTHFEVKVKPVLGNPTGSGAYWGYTPRSATGYGYIDPAAVIGN